MPSEGYRHARAGSAAPAATIDEAATELVELACARIQHALAVLGPIEIHGHSEMSPCWRPLLAALARSVPVTWVAGPRAVPAWLEGKKIEIRYVKPDPPELLLFSCAHPQHEVLEA
jgi:hypothetical protein